MFVPNGKPVAVVDAAVGSAIVPGPDQVVLNTSPGVVTLAFRLSTSFSQTGSGSKLGVADPSQQVTSTLEKVTLSLDAQVWVWIIISASDAPFVHIGPKEIVPVCCKLPATPTISE